MVAQKINHFWRTIGPFVSRDESASQDKNIDDFVQNCSISIANALEILQSCTKSSIGACH